VPAFVINLDRRFDRWKKLLHSSTNHGVTLMRMSAVDGLDLVGMSIPESDVVKIWDSTLNASFDSRCLVNNNMHMTTSERACAASHLTTWRLISTVRKKLVSTNNVFKFQPTNINDKNVLDDKNDYGDSITGVKNSTIIQETLLRSRLGIKKYQYIYSI